MTLVFTVASRSSAWLSLGCRGLKSSLGCAVLRIKVQGSQRFRELERGCSGAGDQSSAVLPPYRGRFSLTCTPELTVAKTTAGEED